MLAIIAILTLAATSAQAAQLRDNTNAKEIKVESTKIEMRSEAIKDAEGNDMPWVEQVGLHPQVFYYHNFLTNAEREHMVKIAAPQMKRSQVSDDKTGGGVIDNIRTSYGMFIRRNQDPVIKNIERRIALWTQIPLENQEDIQVLRYQEGQTYRAHYDSSYDKDSLGPKQRLATFLMYLSDVEEGGETAFPEGSVWADPSLAKRGGPFSACAQGHVAAKPKAGDAVLFYSYFFNGTMDPASMHTGCPVIKGIKWAAPVWIHVDPFRPEELSRPVLVDDQDHGACVDFNPNCAMWKASGECKKNVGFMMETCRLSCGECEMCTTENDYECINRNRKRGGYLEIDPQEMRDLGVDLFQGPQPSPEL